jgi:hypothetical protein
MGLRKVLVVIAVAAAIFAAGASGSPSAPSGQAACARVTIGKRDECLVAGRPCNPRYEKLYQRHGFKCRRNTAGEYRLWKIAVHVLPPAV